MTTVQPHTLQLKAHGPNQKRRPLHIETQSYVPQLNDCLPEETMFRYPIRHGLVWRTEVVPIALLRLGMPWLGFGRRLGIPISGKLAGRFGLPSAAWPAFFAELLPRISTACHPSKPLSKIPHLLLHHFLTKLSGCCYCAWSLSFVADPSCLLFVSGDLLDQSRRQSNICCSPRLIFRLLRIPWFH
jgi:hypothetical protein